MGKNQFVVCCENEWAVKGIAQNQNSELRIQKQARQFQVCSGFGKDTCPPKDRNF